MSVYLSGGFWHIWADHNQSTGAFQGSQISRFRQLWFQANTGWHKLCCCSAQEVLPFCLCLHLLGITCKEFRRSFYWPTTVKKKWHNWLGRFRDKICTTYNLKNQKFSLDRPQTSAPLEIDMNGAESSHESCLLRTLERPFRWQHWQRRPRPAQPKEEWGTSIDSALLLLSLICLRRLGKFRARLMVVRRRLPFLANKAVRKQLLVLLFGLFR